MNSTPDYLKHQFLIAMPHLDDGLFARSLVYLIDHSEEGAMGLIVNQPSGLNLGDILEQLRPSHSTGDASHLEVLNGGPVQPERGFVLHRYQHDYQATLHLGELGLTTSQDILFDLAQQEHPRDTLICLGYAGWSAGQLESELLANLWLTCPADTHILFTTPADQRLEKAAQSLGVDLNLLTTQAGHS